MAQQRNMRPPIGPLLVLLIAALTIALQFGFLQNADAEARHKAALGSLNNALAATDNFYEHYVRMLRVLSELDEVRKLQPTAALTFKRVNTILPQVVNIAGLRVDGTFFASALATNQNAPNLRSSEFVQRAIAGEPRVIMAPHRGPLSSEMVSGVLVPIFDDGRISGVLGASVRLSGLTDRWDDSLAAGVEMLAIGPDNTIIHTSTRFLHLRGRPLREIAGGHSVETLLNRPLQLEGESWSLHHSHADIANTHILMLVPQTVPVLQTLGDHPDIMFGFSAVGVLLFGYAWFYLRDRGWTMHMLQSEERYRTLFTSSPFALLTVNSRGRITLYNPRAASYFNLGETSALGKLLEDALPSRPDICKLLRKALASGQPEGLNRHATETAIGLRFEDIGISFVGTEHSREVLLRIRDTTEEARFDDIMIQTEKMMSIGGLAAGMAHEINNPLSIIMQAIQNTRRRFSPEHKTNRDEAQALGLDLHVVRTYMEHRNINVFLASISEAATRAAHIVADMLDFSRRSNENAQPENIHGLLDRAVHLAAQDYSLKKRYDFRKIHINRQFADRIPPVPCIGNEVLQVVLNLLRNAAHAMADRIAAQPEATPVITLRTTLEANHLRMDIEDNGPGVPADIATRIFEPFFSTKPPGVGTGLGLSISYFIITRNHGGEFFLDPTYTKGARFVIRLPLGGLPQLASPAPAPGVQSPDGQSPTEETETHPATPTPPVSVA